MGTPEFAVASLDALLNSGVEVAAVVTAPDKPAGRGRKIQETPVKQYALHHHLPVLQPESLKNTDFLNALRKSDAQLFVVVAFRMLPEEVWKMPPLGTINLHASLLPEYRGAAPINWAIIRGETRTGTTVFLIDKDIDTGNIVSYSEEMICPEDTAGTLHDKLMHSGAIHLVEAVQSIDSGNYTAVSQENDALGQQLKTAPKIFRETCHINWNQNSTVIHNFIRGLSPYPAAWTTFVTPKDERLTCKIFETEMQQVSHKIAPGSIDSDNRTYLRISTLDGWLTIKNLQLEGKKRMDIQDFLRGIPDISNYKINVG